MITYQGFEIRASDGSYRYHVYQNDAYYMSFDTLSEAKDYIKDVLWMRDNIPF